MRMNDMHVFINYCVSVLAIGQDSDMRNFPMTVYLSKLETGPTCVTRGARDKSRRRTYINDAVCTLACRAH